MIQLEYNAKKIITDSGGVQREAYFLGIPCITLMENTPWIETVNDGWNLLANDNIDKILYGIKEFIPKGDRGNYFGDGHASVKIVDTINKGV